MSKILKVLDCKEDYAYEGPRYIRLGPESGEEFRDNFFIPWLNKNANEKDLYVDFEGTIVYTPSFLEETFGGAIRKRYANQVKDLKFLNLPDEQKKDVMKYIAEALERTKQEK